MQPREQSLNRYFATRLCSSCQRQHLPEAVLVLVRRPRSWMVMVTCGACHHRGIFVVNFPRTALATLPTDSTPQPTTLISYRDVRQMRSFLDTFNGDFMALFDQGSSGHFASE